MSRITTCFVTGFVLLLAIKLSLAGNLHIIYAIYVANLDIVQFSSASEVTTLWCYTNLFIIIIIIFLKK